MCCGLINGNKHVYRYWGIDNYGLGKNGSINVGKDNAGSINMHTDCKVVSKLVTDNRLKASQCALDGGSTIRRIIEI